MNVLIACEFSGIVRDAFLARGHNAVSCDLLDSETGGPHHRGDVRDLLRPLFAWDLLIAHPPCDYLTVSGNRWFADDAVAKPGVLTGAARRAARAESLDFVRELMSAPITRVAIENPIGAISSAIRKPDQIIQPWQYGHGEVKATCLWLKNLPLLTPSNIVTGREPRVHFVSPGPDRWKERSRTLRGIAAAMAEQWGA